MSRLASLFLDQAPTAAIPKAAPGKPQAHPAYTVLFVDDEPSVLKAMRRIFHQENYQFLTAASGAAALTLLEAQPARAGDDFRSPHARHDRGRTARREIKANYPQTIRIMLTGYADVDAVMGAVNEGAVYKFITKPWNDDDLRLTVSLALEQYDLIQRTRR